VLFFLSLYYISLGDGGLKPCLESFGADQFDDDHLKERKKEMSSFNWCTFALCAAMMLGATLVVYVQDFVSWAAACLLLWLSLSYLYMGIPFYRYKTAEGNLFTPILHILIAAIRKGY